MAQERITRGFCTMPIINHNMTNMIRLGISLVGLFIMSMMLSACNLTTQAPTVVPTPDLPQAEFLAPANNQQVYEGIDFDFDIVARDSSAGIARIELYIDEVFINSAAPIDADSVPVFRANINWLAQGVGLHVVEVIPYREDGTRGDATVINLDVIARETTP
jgi:hypothetical protein